ncbi:MAG: T9SS type A sorting domain-containing protein [Bacteroidetes bacterium]|nr:T9SS type A sorting domain-containing protein [Bacteroidota bacterium]
MKKTLTSFLTLFFAYTLSAQTQLSNGGFETWGNSSPGVSAEPTGWYSNKSGSSVAQLGPQICFQDQSVVHSGSSSVRVETKSYFGTAVNGAVTTGVINAPNTTKSNGYIGTVNYSSSSDVRRTAFTGRPDSIVGYYQYTSGGAGEQGKVRAILHNNNYFDPETPTTYHADPTADKIGDALWFGPTSNVGTWTRFSIPFTYVSSATPSYIMINITCSANQTTSITGSKMWVDDISFIYVPVANYTSSSTKCVGSAITFSDQSTNSPTSWNWSFPGGTPSSSTGQNPSVTYSAPGTYTATLISANSTATSVPVTHTFVVTANPNVTVPSATVCAGQSATLTASGASSYVWSTSATTSSVIVTPSVTTIYTVTGTTAGCVGTQTVSVLMGTMPVSVNSATICSGGSATLSASGVSTYTWDSGSNAASIVVSPTVATDYTVTGTSVYGCTAFAIAQVGITSSPVISVNSATICAGQTATLTASGVSSYTWSNNSNNATINVNPTSTAVYTISGQASGCGASAPQTTTVTVHALPSVSMTAVSGTICINNAPVTLSGTPSGGSFSGTGVSGNSFNPATSGAGTFTLTYSYTDANTCTNTSSQLVHVATCAGIHEQQATMVSVFPNPVKDVLIVRVSDVSARYTIEVYDVTGKLVYSAEGQDETLNIQTAAYTKGLYTLKVVSNGRVLVSKFIKE